MKNDPPFYIIFPSVATVAPHSQCADDATRPAICARAPLLHRRDWLVSGDLGGLEAATKRHDHATRGHVARRGVEVDRDPLRFCFSDRAYDFVFQYYFSYDRVVADLVSTGQTEKL